VLIGVVADDFTGAHDVGVAFAAQGFRVTVLEGPRHLAAHRDNADVIVVDTDTREEPSEEACPRVAAAVRALTEARGAVRIYKKLDSAFRGNVGGEIDAVMDVLAEARTVVVPAFPQIGRITSNGHHFVRGLPLQETKFAMDVVGLERSPNLAEILSRQTRRAVGWINGETVGRGATMLRKALDGCWPRSEIVGVDASSAEDLETIAGAVEDLRLACGSAGLARALAGRMPDRRLASRRRRTVPAIRGGPVLVVSGSVTAVSASQVEGLLTAGVHGLGMRMTEWLAEEEVPVDREERLVEEVAAVLAQHSAAVLYVVSDAEELCLLREQAHARGMSEQEIRRFVREALGRVASRIVSVAGVGGLVLTGGDTAAAVCRHLDVPGTFIVREIDLGTALAVTLGGPRLGLVIKPGDFGAKEFHMKAISTLRIESERSS